MLILLISLEDSTLHLSYTSWSRKLLITTLESLSDLSRIPCSIPTSFALDEAAALATVSTRESILVFIEHVPSEEHCCSIFNPPSIVVLTTSTYTLEILLSHLKSQVPAYELIRD